MTQINIIGAFKTVSTKQINQKRDVSGGTIWQRNFYEQIIRKYVHENPSRGNPIASTLILNKPHTISYKSPLITNH